MSRAGRFVALYQVMIIESGSKLLISHRRLFDNDTARFFLGTVDGYEHGIVRVTGYTWVRDPFAGAFCRKEGLRTKILSLASGTLIVYQLPAGVDVSGLTLEGRADGATWLTDGSRFKLDISEFAHPRRGKIA